jgi:eukaryotic-like serine/threonine-protein kinase
MSQAMSQEMSQEKLPRKLGRYEVRGKVGEGGMAIVYIGVGPETLSSQNPSTGQGSQNQVFALKVIKDAYAMNTEFVTMFTDEAKIVSRLSHPNIVRVHELGAQGNRLFMAMEFLSGRSLWHVWNALRERGVRLRYDVAAWLGARVAEGLHHAHELRDPRSNELLEIVHRDVNASNIFVTYSGSVKVIDFGLARAVNRVTRTRAGMVKGKLAYMSPEQVLGKAVDRTTDLYALGITLWELTADRRLFKGNDDVETMENVHNAVIPDPTELVEGYPPGLWAVLQKCLERDPAKRFRDGRDLAASLDAVARAEGRAVGEQVLGGIMRALYTEEIKAQEEWLASLLRTSSDRISSMPKAQGDSSLLEPARNLGEVAPQRRLSAEFAIPSSFSMPKVTPSPPAVAPVASPSLQGNAPSRPAEERRGASGDGASARAETLFGLPLVSEPPPQMVGAEGARVNAGHYAGAPRIVSPGAAPTPPVPKGAPRAPVHERVAPPVAKSKQLTPTLNAPDNSPTRAQPKGPATSGTPPRTLVMAAGGQKLSPTGTPGATTGPAPAPVANAGPGAVVQPASPVPSALVDSAPFSRNALSLEQGAHQGKLGGAPALVGSPAPKGLVGGSPAPSQVPEALAVRAASPSLTSSTPRSPGGSTVKKSGPWVQNLAIFFGVGLFLAALYWIVSIALGKR